MKVEIGSFPHNPMRPNAISKTPKITVGDANINKSVSKFKPKGSHRENFKINSPPN